MNVQGRFSSLRKFGIWHNDKRQEVALGEIIIGGFSWVDFHRRILSCWERFCKWAFHWCGGDRFSGHHVIDKAISALLDCAQSRQITFGIKSIFRSESGLVQAPCSLSRALSHGNL